MQLSDYITQVQSLVHDSSSIDFSQADLTNYINAARKRVALDFHCVRTFFNGGGTTIAGQEIYPITGGCMGAKVTSGGGTYSAPPSVTFGPPPAGGVTATGVAVMTGTAPTMSVAQIQMTNWGSGYTTAVPTVTFGSGTATALALPMANVIDIYTITSLNGTQRTTNQWKPFAEFQAFFRANTLNSGQPVVWTNYNEQNSFYLYPIPDQASYVLEIDAITLPNPLVNLSDVDLQILDPPADAVQFYAAHLALYKLQNFDQSEKMEQKYMRRTLSIFGTRYAPRLPNIYQTYWRRVQRGW